MSASREANIAYFMKLTHCEKDIAIGYFEEADGKLDQALNTFFERNNNQDKSNTHSKRIDAPFQQYENKPNARAYDSITLLPKMIIIPTMIEFQK